MQLELKREIRMSHRGRRNTLGDRPVQFEFLEPTSEQDSCPAPDEFAFSNWLDHADRVSARRYARLVDEWVTRIGLRPEDYGAHLLRRTAASIIYKQTGNLRAV
jgi:hypothetical protein